MLVVKVYGLVGVDGALVELKTKLKEIISQCSVKQSPGEPVFPEEKISVFTPQDEYREDLEGVDVEVKSRNSEIVFCGQEIADSIVDFLQQRSRGRLLIEAWVYWDSKDGRKLVGYALL
ncbi:MAG: hypothetical protein UX26_C0026G0004 [Parcubacteria group bacterium GW2011_GWC1_45_9]|nr:MAG: hypothetical protein UW85_C0003G0044 [Parcubacteria group bacterium GW2011_GWA1_Parcubacteria_45_10]KKT87810.1 MAG: hypothetical protein UW89_C0017G0002 [Parcubacteria group bacterium GW2011_GWB1_45_10]KKU16351.1 MAG: hypothetical protein UX26_C0026G0004 [Parcubacteria group bacterium GW2011_GWC1_45_9]HCI05131.1 hypothetical protein [Patescibacteria group bacterium]